MATDRLATQEAQYNAAAFAAGLQREQAKLLKLAYTLCRGAGGTSDEERGVQYLLSAAKLGSSAAMYNLALCYLFGTGVKRSLARSRYWASKCLAQLDRLEAEPLRAIGASAENAGSARRGLRAQHPRRVGDVPALPLADAPGSSHGAAPLRLSSGAMPKKR